MLLKAGISLLTDILLDTHGRLLRAAYQGCQVPKKTKKFIKDVKDLEKVLLQLVNDIGR